MPAMINPVRRVEPAKVMSTKPVPAKVHAKAVMSDRRRFTLPFLQTMYQRNIKVEMQEAAERKLGGFGAVLQL
jgi:hypothetical protein